MQRRQIALQRELLVMPALLVPALWAGGTAVVLGGGYYLLQLFHVIPWRRRGTGSMANTPPKKKVEEVLREHKRGTLRSGSGKQVKSRKQAAAIAMSESGQPQRRKPSQSRRRKAS